MASEYGTSLRYIHIAEKEGEGKIFSWNDADYNCIIYFHRILIGTNEERFY